MTPTTVPTTLPSPQPTTSHPTASPEPGSIPTTSMPTTAHPTPACRRAARRRCRADPDRITIITPVAAAEHRSIGKPDGQPDESDPSPSPTDLAGPDDRTHAARSRPIRPSTSLWIRIRRARPGPTRVTAARRHLFIIRRRHARGGRGFDRPPAAEALVVHGRLRPPRAERGER